MTKLADGPVDRARLEVHSPPRQEIVFVEPCAGVLGGHMLEKLLLWCKGVSQLGFAPTVVSWDRPWISLPADIPIIAIGAGPKAPLKFVPKKQRPKYREFWTYHRAFQLATRSKCPVLGLTASSPIPIAIAAAIAKPQHGWGQIVMYGGLVDTPKGVRIRPRARMSFQQLLRGHCHLLCNAPLTVEMLGRMAEKYGAYVHHLPDPIDIPTKLKRTDCSPGAGLRVLVPGQDDHRRTPLWHLSHLNDVKVEELVVHEPGKTVARLHNGLEWSQPPAVRRLRVLSDYLAGETLTSLFAHATVSLLAYSEDFLQGSANLALSVVCGTPVLCTRFPYANYLEARYGRIGEFFRYGDIKGFNNAVSKLAQWRPTERAEFEAARVKLIADVDHRGISRAALCSIGALATD
jgi:hypothetical protein